MTYSFLSSLSFLADLDVFISFGPFTADVVLVYVTVIATVP